MVILFVVESPGKIKKIQQFLGKEYIVDASKGIFRDLDEKKISIDIENNYEPLYVITKPDVVKTLKEHMKKADILYLATDLDREGAGIAQSILDVLKPKKYKRIRYNAITKEAIMKAIKEGGEIEKNLVDAQKARRVIDRLFGYKITPILKDYLGSFNSVGRVQSVATRLIVDKENEIINFITKNKNCSFFKVNGLFNNKFKSLLHQSSDKDPWKLAIGQEIKGKQAQISESDDMINAMKKFLRSEFIVNYVARKEGYRSPSPPFITSTLQQEANRKLGMSIDATMRNAQKLYEAGLITYMRTDSVEIAEEGHKEIKKVITEKFGNDHYRRTDYKNKNANTQEAHECIRPVHPELENADGEFDDYQKKLYKLIWQRTIASQMERAKIETTIMQIKISKYDEKKLDPYYYFQSSFERIVWSGFMKVYVESKDDQEEEVFSNEMKVPKEKTILQMTNIIAKQEYLKPPPRYTEASMVKKLEEIGVGRPSTFVTMVRKVIDKEYVKISDVGGIEKDIEIYSVNSDNSGKHIMEIKKETEKIFVGKETKKLIPTNLGKDITQFMIDYFPDLIDYKFTAKMEDDLDAVANGTIKWYKMVDKFYKQLMPIIDTIKTTKISRKDNDKVLGNDDNGNVISIGKRKYGMTVIRTDKDGKLTYAKIPEDTDPESITLKDAIKLLKYPKILGKYDKNDVLLRKGKHGFYIEYNETNYTVPSDKKENDITLEFAINVINEKKRTLISEFKLSDGKKKYVVNVLDGKYGPYLKVSDITTKTRKTFNIPLRGTDPKSLTDKSILELIKSYSKKSYIKKESKNTESKGGSKTNKKIIKKK